MHAPRGAPYVWNSVVAVGLGGVSAAHPLRPPDDRNGFGAADWQQRVGLRRITACPSALASAQPLAAPRRSSLAAANASHPGGYRSASSAARRAAVNGRKLPNTDRRFVRNGEV